MLENSEDRSIICSIEFLFFTTFVKFAVLLCFDNFFGKQKIENWTPE